MSFYKSCFKFLMFGLMTGMLTSCMVGPNWVRPKSPHPCSYTETPLPRKTASTPSIKRAGRSQTFRVNADIPVEWWRLFHSPEIDYLVRLGITNSPNLAAAKATLRKAQQIFYVTLGNSLYPAIDANFTSQRQRFTGASFGGSSGGSGFSPSIFNVFSATLNVSYSLDVFGGLRRKVEAAGADVDFQEFETIAAYLTLTTNIVTTAVSTASLQEQIISTKELIGIQNHFLQILRKQFQLGGIALSTVLTQETLVEQTNALLPPLQKNLSIARHALAVLVGVTPDYPLPRINLNRLHLPKDLPISLPSNLVRQRPDVLAAEATLHSASAQIGVATADLLPKFDITGFYGWQAPTIPDLFRTSTNVWSIANSITQPIFHGGALIAARREAIANYEQACAEYQQTVLQAFQNVGDTLRAIETDARALRAERQAEIAAHHSLILTADQYRLGGATYLSILIAQQQYEETRLARIRAEELRFSDTATLFQALGGGWWEVGGEFCRWRWCR